MKRFFKITQVTLILLLSSCSPQNKKTNTAKNSLVYCSEASPSAFNPQITTDGTSLVAAGLTIYNRLVDFKYGGTEIIPSLAERWEISEDQKTYTFYLKKNVKFHTTSYFKPKRNFNADDVLFSILRQWDEKHPYYNVNGSSYEYFQSMNMKELIESVQKVDDYTVIITLKRPDSPFIANMAMGFMSILSKEYADHLAKKGKKEKIDHQPIGTGPFTFVKYEKDSLIRYKGFEDYFEGPAKIQKLIFAITPDASVRLQKLKKGECDIITEPSPQDITSIHQETDLKLISSPGINIGFLAMNMQKPPLNNLKVREAINTALNRKNYIEAIYLGNAIEAISPIPPTMWSYNDQLKKIIYDPDKAKKLLEESGESLPIKLKLWTLPVSRPYNPNGKKMGELMQADLKKIGIEIDLETFDWPTFLSKSREGSHDLIQFGWGGDNGDPDNFLYILLSCNSVEAGSNTARWCHKEFDEIITKAKEISDNGLRTELYRKAQEIFRQELPWAPLAHSIIFKIHHKNLKGYKIDPLGGDRFYHVFWE